MVHLNNRPWQILAVSEKVAGYWPYQSRTTNFLLRMATTVTLVSYMIPMQIRLVEEWNVNLAIVVENIVLTSILILVCTRIISASLLAKLRKSIVDQVAEDFATGVDEEEARILHHYANEGLRAALTFIVVAFVTCGIFDGLPILEMYLPYFNGNQTVERKIPIYVDYLVDEQDYFYYMLAHILITVSLAMIAEFSYDLTFFLTTYHACARFALVRHRIEKASDIFSQSVMSASNSDEEEAYQIIISAVDQHNKAVQMVESINSIYNMTWFFVLLLNTIFVAPFPMLLMLYLDSPIQLVRYGMAFVMVLLHFYMIFLQGQNIIDHSSDLFNACYGCNWHNASKKSKVAISIMMRQSSVICQITGGNMFVLSMETYGKMLKTGLSYFSLFAALF